MGLALCSLSVAAGWELAAVVRTSQMVAQLLDIVDEPPFGTSPMTSLAN